MATKARSAAAVVAAGKPRPIAGSSNSSDAVAKAERMLSDMKQELEVLQAERKRLDEKVRLGNAAAPKKPMLSDEKIDQEIERMEYKRTTTSLSLNDEKKLVKEIESLKADKLRNKKYEQHMVGVNALAEQRAEVIAKIKTREEAISELQRRMKTLELAAKAGVAAEDLKTIEVEVPTQFLGGVIGKKGANLTRIEQECGVSIQVVDTEEKVRITGSETGCEAAKAQIQLTTLASEETIGLHPDKIKVILRYRPEIEAQSGARLIINREQGTLKLLGLSPRIAQAKELIGQYTTGQVIVPVEPRLVATIIGKKGARIKSIEEESGAVVDVGEKALGQVVLHGRVEDVAKAKAILDDIIKENEEHTYEIPVQSSFINFMLEDKGAGMKQLRSQCPGCFIDVDKDLLLFKLRGTSAQLQTATAAITAELEAFESGVERVKADPHAVSLIIGKSGARVKHIQETTGAKIDVDKAASVILIRGEAEAVAKAKALVTETIRTNQRAVVKIPHQEVAYALSANDKAELLRIQYESLATIVVLRRDMEIVITGTTEHIELAKQGIARVIDENQVETVEIDEEDVHLLIGPGGSVIKKLREETGANIRVEKDNKTIQIVGNRDKIKAAKKAIIQITEGSGNGDNILLEVQPEAIGTIVGKSGATVKKFQEEFGVTIDVRKSGKSVRIKGEPENVSKCRAAILKIINDTIITATVDIPAEKAGRVQQFSSLLKDLEADGGVTVNFTPDKKAVKIRGNGNVVGAARRRVQMLVKDWLEEPLPVLTEHLTALPAKNIQQIKEKHGVNLTPDKELGALVLAGPVENVLAARGEVEQLLRFFFQSHYKDVVVPKGAIALLMRKRREIEQATGALLSPDARQGRVTLIGRTDEDIVKAREEVQNAVEEHRRTHQEVDVKDPYLASFLVGKKGATITKLAKETGAKLDLNRDAKVLIITGEGEAVAAAKEAVEALIEKYHKENAVLEVDEEEVPSLIGKGGSGIKRLREETGCNINISDRGGVIHLQGSEEAIAQAKEEIKRIIGDKMKVTLSCSSYAAGQVIGKGGATVKEIQSSTGAKIDVNRESRTVVIKGSEEEVEEAKQRVEKIIEEANKSAPPPPPPAPVKSKQENEEEEKPADAPSSEAPKTAPGFIPGLHTRQQQPVLAAKLSKSAAKRQRKKMAKGGEDADVNIVNLLVGAEEEKLPVPPSAATSRPPPAVSASLSSPAVSQPVSKSKPKAAANAVSSFLVDEDSDNVQPKGAKANGESYYRSTAGYSIRL